MKLKTADATVSLSPWTASVGAKAPLQKAWVKISNIPLDKRCETNVFYAGGLVGVSLDLDASTLHKPEYVKVLIGCRDIDMIPSNAEGCLGDNFYDFYYEVDKKLLLANFLVKLILLLLVTRVLLPRNDRGSNKATWSLRKTLNLSSSVARPSRCSSLTTGRE
jgi:hypothetical protein